MADWLSSMQQTYEFYTVDPESWQDVKRLDNIKDCSIDRDAEAETLGHATFETVDTLGECYVRVYLITIQNGVKEKHPLGTYLVQTPSSNFDGKVRSVSMDAYTPLLELKEKQPPLGYSILKGGNIMDLAGQLTRENLRAPVVTTTCSEILHNDFVADPSETWLAFNKDLMANAKYEYSLDEMGRILFSPKQDTASLQPVWTYDDSNSSILYPELSLDHDLYGIPNVVEVVSSTTGASSFVRVVNDDPNSPTSTVSRGREIIHRIDTPNISLNFNESGEEAEEKRKTQITEYAKQLLRDLSAIEYTVTYTHAYCPVRLGDCVRLNYSRAGLTDVKAKVISQSIKCTPGCPVTETAVFTTKLWR